MKEHGHGEVAASSFHQPNTNENEQQVETPIVTPDRPHRESTGDILAATAIAGHVTASDDLPYMTPPAHFSGDSQDSGSKFKLECQMPTALIHSKTLFSEGYTSISVREPLSAIRAETKASRKNDPHYATVSDDSDDMYAAIDDPSQVYTSESETYAQIQPGTNRSQSSAPQPPSVDSLKQMTVTSQSHSRQGIIF